VEAPDLSAGGPEDLPHRLFPPEPGDIQWGVERTRAILAELGDPHLALPYLHVGGTNGKGSVARIWAEVLSSSGRRTGVYTSPHLTSFTERFLIGGRPVPEARLLELGREIRPVLERHSPSHFEAATALAFLLFRQVGVDVGIAEVGLGGRLDATNVLLPRVTAVTNVALDHQGYLGPSLRGIAREKAGIFKTGVPAVVAEARPALRSLFCSWARQAGAPLLLVDPRRDVRILESGVRGTVVELDSDQWGPLRLHSPLPGRHQGGNILVAVRALELLPPELRPDRDAVVEGVAGARLPGRVEVLADQGGVLVLDVAHNPAGARALAHTLGSLELPRPWVLVAGILADKEWRAMLPPLLARVDRAFLSVPDPAPRDRRWDPFEVAAALFSPVPLQVVPRFSEALTRAREVAGKGTVVVTGSFPAVGEARIRRRVPD
jgi:dihydrofolate synthase / folylpolyglutamate synthase